MFGLPWTDGTVTYEPTCFGFDMSPGSSLHLLISSVEWLDSTLHTGGTGKPLVLSSKLLEIMILKEYMQIYKAGNDTY